MTFKNHFNSIPVTGEINHLPSLTIPGQAMTIQEIIQRSYNGLSINEGRIPLFSEDPENDLLQGVNVKTLDLSELQDLQNFAKQRIKDLREDLKQQEAEQAASKKTKEDSDLTSLAEVISTKLKNTGTE